MEATKKSTQEHRKTSYEKALSFNSIVVRLHSYRFHHLIKEFEKFSRKPRSKPIRIVDIGCAHSKAYALLNPKFKIDYIGIDVNTEGTAAAQERHGYNKNFDVRNNMIQKELETIKDVDVVLALETLEHIPEDNVVRVIERIAQARPEVFICSVPIEIGPAIWFKNVGSFIMGYDNRKRQNYTWRETFWAGIMKLDKLPPHGTSHKGFDWRWLAQTIRYNMRIKKIKKFPFNFLPPSLSSHVFIVAEPR